MASPEKSLVPEHETYTTKNGATVYYFPSPNIPLFEVRLFFEGGCDRDPDGLSGLTMMAASMIRRGVPGLDEDAISRRMDDLAATIDVSVGEERTSVAAYGLNEHAAPILDQLFQEIARPTFPDKPFQRLKTNNLDSIRHIPDSPGSLASYVLDLLLFNGTPKARPGGGLLDDVARIGLADARSFYQTMFRVDRLRALVVGGRGNGILDRVLTGIEALPCPGCGIAPPVPRDQEFRRWRVPPGTTLVLERPGITEAHVAMGFVGPRRNIPEFHDLRVAETILSGRFSSRMNLILREKLNLTYGVSAGFTFGESVGAFNVVTSTRNDKIGELLAATKKLLSDFAGGEIRDEEIQAAKDYLAGSFPLGLQNIYLIAESFFRGLLYGLDPGFLDGYRDRIAAVTRSSLIDAVRTHFRLAELKTVVTGDSRQIAPRLRQAGIRFTIRKPAVYL